MASVGAAAPGRRRWRVAIVGLGLAVTPHARSLLDLAGRVEVVHAFSRSEERRRAFAARFPFPVTGDLDGVLNDPAVDVVLILTPPNTHLDVGRRAAAAGKHVLVEKPLEVTVARGEALAEACRSAGVRLGVVLQHRYRPAFQRLNEMVAAGELGVIVAASAGIRLWRPQGYYDEPGRGTRSRDGGGVLLTQGIHTLDLLLALAGDVAEAGAFSTTTPIHRMETEDLVVAALRFAGGAFGTIEATTAAYPGFPERLEVAGTKGSAVMAGARLDAWLADGRTESVGVDAAAGGTGADPMAFPHDHHRALLSDFLDALEDDREPGVGAAAALKVHRLIDRLLGPRIVAGAALLADQRACQVSS
jgi:predicted dehydrogenase